MYTFRTNATKQELNSVPGSGGIKMAEATEIGRCDISLLSEDETGRPIAALLLVPAKKAGDTVTSYAVSMMQVAPSHRQSGVECALLKEAGRLAAQRGGRRIHVPVQPKNGDMVTLCADMGHCDGVAFVVCLDRCGL